MDIRKQAQRGGFVCDAVLQAENRLLPHARRAQGLQRFDGVLRLHRQADQVVMAIRDLAGMRDDRHRDHDLHPGWRRVIGPRFSASSIPPRAMPMTSRPISSGNAPA
jgi:hypothetical protein